MKIFHILIVSFFALRSLAECGLPADITFLIVDYKYGKDQGVKICEIQTANVSNFDAYEIVYQEKNQIYNQYCQFIQQYQSNVWSSKPDLYNKKLINECSKSKWNVLDSTRSIFNNGSFLRVAKQSVQDPHDLTAYHGAIYCRPSRLAPIDQLNKKYPGILVIDASIFPYQNNKLKISKLFDSDPTLAKYRPRWNVYPKKYSKNLSKKIIEDFQHSKIVIKPQRSSLGKGVIIVDANNIDTTLKLIFNNKKRLRKKRDTSYSHWLYDKDNTFIVEEFVHSDPIHISHLNNQVYDPTYRATFLLYYHNQEVNIKFIEHLTKLPGKSLDSNGTLNEKHKTIIKQPYYDMVADDQKTELEEALTPPLLKMYKLMLDQKTVD